jgi:transposase InsO family protein
MVVSDNGTELTSRAILQWQEDHGVEWHYIAPGKPMQNGFVESLNGRFRDECLNKHMFRNLPRAPADRGMEDGLQRPPAAHEPWRSHPKRVCNPDPQGPKRAQSPVMNEGKQGATSAALRRAISVW